MSIPFELDFNSGLPEIPSGQGISCSASPSNGQTFSPSANPQIFVDIPSRGFLIGSSLAIRYKYVATSAANTQSQLSGTPVYTPFQSLQTLQGGSQLIENIPNYNQLCNMICNLTMSNSQKGGMEAALGYGQAGASSYFLSALQPNTTAGVGTATVAFTNTTGIYPGMLADATGIPTGTTVVSLVANTSVTFSATITTALLINTMVSFYTNAAVQSYNGRQLGTAGETGYFSAPLPCCLANAKQWIPMFKTGMIRLVFTLDSFANMVGNSSAPQLTGFTISNFELMYQICDFGPERNASLINNKGPQLIIKSLTSVVSSQVLPAASSGSIDYSFNIRASSVKSLILITSGVAAHSINGLFDSFDPTSRAGEVSFSLNSTQYPQKPLSMLNNPMGALIELKRASTALMIPFSGVYDRANDFDISGSEWNYLTDNATTSLNVPAKVYLGVSTEICHNNSALLSGISTNGQPVGVRLNMPTANAAAHNLTLVAVCDLVLLIDLDNGQLSYRL